MAMGVNHARHEGVASPIDAGVARDHREVCAFGKNGGDLVAVDQHGARRAGSAATIENAHIMDKLPHAFLSRSLSCQAGNAPLFHERKIIIFSITIVTGYG
jgi:hypothetical protein